MKKILPLAAALSLTFASGVSAAPFMAIGDGAELFIAGTVGIRADDNIFLTAKETDDIIIDINPALELTFGKNAQIKGALTVQESFTNYADNSDLNSNLFSTSLSTRFDDGKLKLGFNLAFSELNQNNADIRPPVNGLTRRDVFTAGGNAEVEVSQRTAVGAGLNFNRENYKTRGYTDSESFSVPLDFYYKLTPKVDLSLAYRYGEHDVDVGSDSTDHTFLVGARGDFTPKLSGRFGLGLGTRDVSRGGDSDLLALDLSFAYEISPKTSLQVGASNSFGTSPQGQQQKNFTLNAAVNTKLSEVWSVNAGISYRQIDYFTREDDYIEGKLGANFVLNANVNISGGYTHRKYESALVGSDFSNNVFSLAANLRY